MPLRLMKIALFSVALLYIGVVHSEAKIDRVLFIGNSLTYYNNLPTMISNMAENNGHELVVESYAPGGAVLKNHALNPVVSKNIESNAWDFVVLQEQSQRPGFSRSQVSRDVYPYAKNLSEKVRDVNSHSKVVFYMTMARRNGDPGNENVSPELLTYEGAQKRVNRSYIEMGKSNRAIVAPIGEVWRVMREEKPGINLYADEIHPNLTGSYLAACVFYTTFFNKSTVGSLIPEGVDRQTGKYIQELVDRIVLNSNGKWNFENHISVPFGMPELIVVSLLFFILVLPWLMVLLSKKVKGARKVIWFFMSFLFSWFGYLIYYLFSLRRDRIK